MSESATNPCEHIPELLREVRALGELLRSGVCSPGYLTLDQAATYLHVPAETLRKWCRTKGVPYHKPGKALLFRVKDLDQWMGRYRRGDKGLALHGYNRVR